MENKAETTYYSIGVDLGGTNTCYGLVDPDGVIVTRGQFPTGSFETVDAWADYLSDALSESLLNVTDKEHVIGIGIGAPCANTSTGCVEKATDLPWPSPIPLAAMLEKRTGLRVTLGNDANAAALGEMVYGAARGLKNFIVLTLGTGVGAGIVCDGHLLSGSRGFAGELGHVTFPFASDRPCGCGRRGCLQTVASAKGVVTTASRMLSGSDTQSLLRAIPESELTSRLICEAALKGDPVAIEVFRFTGECLGRAAAEFAAFSDPDAIVLFGGVSRAGDLILEPMRKAFRENALFLYNDRVQLLLSRFADADAAILGAAALCK